VEPRTSTCLAELEPRLLHLRRALRAISAISLKVEEQQPREQRGRSQRAGVKQLAEAVSGEPAASSNRSGSTGELPEARTDGCSMSPVRYSVGCVHTVRQATHVEPTAER